VNAQKPPKKPRLKLIDWIALVLAACALGWIYRGFFSPDPYMLEKGAPIRALRWCIVAVFPPAAAGLLYLYAAVRVGRIKGLYVLAAAVSGLFALLLAYPVAVWVYAASYERQIEKYHPYLQLTPNPFERRASKLPAYVVMCLGGSTTEFVDPSHRGWPLRVEEHLQGSIAGKEVQFYNMGRQWYTTQHTLINYELNLRQYHPDMIIIMQAVNDLLINADFSFMSHGAFREDYGHFHGPVNRLIRRKSFLEFTGEMLGGLWYHMPRKVTNTDTFPGLVSYRRNLEAIIEMAQHDGTKVVLMTEPYLFKENMSPEELAALNLINAESIGPDEMWSVDTARRGMEKYDELMRSIALEHKLVLVDLERAIPKTLEYFYDEVHYRAAVFDKVADFISSELRRTAPFNPAGS
jgi:hypothetical protein